MKKIILSSIVVLLFVVGSGCSTDDDFVDSGNEAGWYPSKITIESQNFTGNVTTTVVFGYNEKNRLDQMTIQRSKEGVVDLLEDSMVSFSYDSRGRPNEAIYEYFNVNFTTRIGLAYNSSGIINEIQYTDENEVHSKIEVDYDDELNTYFILDHEKVLPDGRESLSLRFDEFGQLVETTTLNISLIYSYTLAQAGPFSMLIPQEGLTMLGDLYFLNRTALNFSQGALIEVGVESSGGGIGIGTTYTILNTNEQGNISELLAEAGFSGSSVYSIQYEFRE
ncbi:hypothetical protein GCM10009117_15740 [Gangjinia marincola]|uniref:YD repeat-containing protein n=1 Tax=Gangjinia marincola TaxID=578463 RepID=A0ABP3XT88_9FLAO